MPHDDARPDAEAIRDRLEEFRKDGGSVWITPEGRIRWRHPRYEVPGAWPDGWLPLGLAWMAHCQREVEHVLRSEAGSEAGSEAEGRE